NLVADVVEQTWGLRRHEAAPNTEPRLLRRNGRACRTPPPCPCSVCVIAVSLLVGSKADHRTVPDRIGAEHRIRRIVPATVSKLFSAGQPSDLPAETVAAEELSRASTEFVDPKRDLNSVFKTLPAGFLGSASTTSSA